MKLYFEDSLKSCWFVCVFKIFNSLVLGKLLGEGAFGMVVKAEVLRHTGKCTAKMAAVKMLKGNLHLNLVTNVHSNESSVCVQLFALNYL